MSSRTEQTDSIFETVADTEYSRKDKYIQIYDQFIRAPSLIIWNDWRGKAGLIIIFFYLLMGIVGPRVVAPPSAVSNQGPLFVGPFVDWQFPLGTDQTGTDIGARIIYSTPNMFLMMFSGALFTVVVGSIVGATAGFVGGKVDVILSTISDIFMTIPGLPLIIVLASIISPENPIFIGLILSINLWASLARQIRSEVLSIRHLEYVEASRAMGVRTPYIIMADILPNLMPYITVNFVRSSRVVLFSSVALYFLGILPFTNVNWGVMMNQANEMGGLISSSSQHALLIPMVAITGISVGLTLVAQASDHVFNPRARVRHSKTAAESDEL
jgi:peptide/nickel transport system permease protein